MGFLKKKKMGFEPKNRTRHEIDTDYSEHAFRFGHKQLLIKILAARAERLEQECAEHLNTLMRLKAEGDLLPAEETKEKKLDVQKEDPSPTN
jgi:hypothetical protein